VRVADLDLDVSFEAGEALRTEISAKFTRGGVEDELGAAGMHVLEQWTDEDGDFLLTLAEVN
jgi:L-histidine N-alpha-methyltransferase